VGADRHQGRRLDRAVALRARRPRRCAGLEVSTGYGNIFWRLMLMALGMGLTMAPATSRSGSLPLAKRVSARRERHDPSGRRCIGCRRSSAVFSPRRTAPGWRPLNGQQLPAGRGERCQELARFRASRPPAGSVARQGTRLRAPPAQPSSRMHQGYLVGAAVLILGAIAAAIWLPARARRPVEELEVEYEASTRPPDGTPDGKPTPVDVPSGGVEPAFRTCRPPGAEMSDTAVGAPDAPERPRGRPPVGDRGRGDPGRGRRAVRRARLRRRERGGRRGARRREPGDDLPALPVEGRSHRRGRGLPGVDDIAFPDTGNLPRTTCGAWPAPSSRRSRTVRRSGHAGDDLRAASLPGARRGVPEGS